MGLIQRIEVVTQFQEKIGYFTNYMFEFTVLSLASENEELNWDWITARRKGMPLKETLKLAPLTWKQWVADGQLVLEKTRRRVSKLNVTPRDDQLPRSGSREAKVLDRIYKFYSAGKRHKFELLASRVVQGLISRSGGTYKEGWITQASGDGGVDFVGRIDLSMGFSSVKVVVLGQAKCEKPLSGTNGRDIARTVARLRRGWVGAYVTTSFFTEKSQIEVIEDQYPLIMVNGSEVASEVLRLMGEAGFSQVEAFLEELEQDYNKAILQRRPEEILYD